MLLHYRENVPSSRHEFIHTARARTNEVERKHSATQGTVFFCDNFGETQRQLKAFCCDPLEWRMIAMTTSFVAKLEPPGSQVRVSNDEFSILYGLEAQCELARTSRGYPSPQEWQAQLRLSTLSSYRWPWGP